MGNAAGPQDENEARVIALLAVQALEGGDGLALFDDAVERPFGWVFRFNSKRFVETSEAASQVPGCGPLIVDRATGESVFLPTFRPAHLLINEYEAAWRTRHGG